MSKEARFDLRGDSEKKDIIQRAANVSNQSLSQFMIEAAYTTAQLILSDRNHFVLNDDDWERFNELLDAEPKDIPELKRLFQRKSVFRN